jgi:hypothetical protein
VHETFPGHFAGGTPWQCREVLFSDWTQGHCYDARVRAVGSLSMETLYGFHASIMVVAPKVLTIEDGQLFSLSWPERN